jgi:hypothetical protein
MKMMTLSNLLFLFRGFGTNRMLVSLAILLLIIFFNLGIKNNCIEPVAKRGESQVFLP